MLRLLPDARKAEERSTTRNSANMRRCPSDGSSAWRNHMLSVVGGDVRSKLHARVSARRKGPAGGTSESDIRRGRVFSRGRGRGAAVGVQSYCTRETGGAGTRGGTSLFGKGEIEPLNPCSGMPRTAREVKLVSQGRRRCDGIARKEKKKRGKAKCAAKLWRPKQAAPR